MPEPRDFCEPGLAQWPELIAGNSRLPKLLSLEKISSLRQKIFRDSIEFTRLVDSGQRIVDGNHSNRQPLVMTGHQPVIYHYGLFYKNLVLNEFVSKNELTGINVIVDTDEGDGGAFLYPVLREGVIANQTANLAENNGLYMYQWVVAQKKIEEEFGKIRSALAGLGQNIKNIECIERIYADLSGRSVVEANAAARRRYSLGQRYYELPLSFICRYDETRDFFAAVIRDADKFAATYNRCLGEYRLSHGIKNMANPFPDLAIDSGEVELPLWIVDTGNRSRKTLVIQKGQFDLPATSFLAPKAVLLSIFLRQCCSDLFIRGLGGARYDQFVDIFVRAYYWIEPVRSVTVSADRYIFPELREREICYHPERYLELFVPRDQEAIRLLVKEKAVAISTSEDTKQRRKSRAQTLKTIDEQIKGIVVAGLEEEIRKYHDVAGCREYPFFLIQDSKSRILNRV